ncbi:MAG TPA: lysine--tRNA ligase, partial [Syntrophomonas wolfei]|nr:lysine--tRNA ligase [Syntrophomonas wolfei]
MSESELNINELKKVRLEKLAELKEMGIEPFGRRFERDSMAQNIKETFSEWEGKTIAIAGRIMSKRRHGKAGFANLADLSGSIQLYFRQDDLGPEKYELYKKLDIGDILGIQGEVFRTQKGEISIHVRNLYYLSKSLTPLPEKWHG